MSDRKTALARILGVILVTTMAGCGGSGDSTGTNVQPPPATATAQTTVGQIAGFGSIYVNGVRYDTAGASYDVDDTTASDDTALAVGMVVKIQGSVNADGVTGKADSVSYDDEIEGIVQDLATDAADPEIKTFTVLGIAIRADLNGTNFEGEDDPNFSFDTIMNGDNVEVSGEYSGDVLIASYIEKQDASDDDFEVKGTIEQYDGNDSFVLVLRNDAALDVTLAAGARIPSVGIANGQYVEVEGTIPDPVNAPNSLLASKVELEDDDRLDDDDRDEVKTKGILNYDMDAGSWSVKDIVLAFDASTKYKPASLGDSIADMSAAGLYVEVEGRYVNDVLEVHEIELEEDELEFNASVEAISSTGPKDGTITLSFGMASGTIDVQVTADTIFRDDDSVQAFDLGSIMASDKIEIEARWGDDGLIYASNLHLEDNDSEYEIEGPLEAIDDVSITVLGIGFSIDASTFFEDGLPVVGDYVEVEDENGDGIADSVEIED